MKMVWALNNLQWLICYKRQQSQTTPSQTTSNQAIDNSS